jgi:predicted MFS family arabinose efflux permease
MPTLTNRWSVLALVCFARTSFAMQFQSIPPLVPLLRGEMGLNYAQIGTLIGVYMLAGIVIALPGGLFGQWAGDKAVMVTGLALMTLGTVGFALAPGYGTALAGRLVGGVGAVLLNVQVTKVVSDWFAGREISTAMGLLLATWPLGFALSLSILGWVGAVWSWRVAIGLTALFSGLALLPMLLTYRDLPARGQTAAAPQPRRRLWQISGTELLLIVAAGLVWQSGNAGFIIFFGFAPDYLAAHGMSPAAAASLVSVGTWILIVATPTGGWLTDRTGRPNLSIVLGTLGSTVAFLMVSLGGWPVLWIVVFGLINALWPGAVMALPGQVLSGRALSTGLGVFFTIYYVSMAGLPALAGWVQDATGDPATTLRFAAVLMLGTIGFLALFRRLQGRAARPVPADGA